MDQNEWLTEQFEENRAHLQAVAYRMLGSESEADDAVQEAWLRLNRTGAGEVENLGGWLTTVVSRICLNILRSRRSRKEEPLDAGTPEPAGRHDPEHHAVMDDAVGPALLVILETLAPAERLAFVLHDMFGVPFDEIAPIVDRTPAAARQLASRARRRVRGSRGDAASSEADRVRQREIVDAFLAASRNGRFAELLALLDPDVVLRGDRSVVNMGAPAEVRGAEAVAGFFDGRAEGARLALIDGDAGAVWSAGGRPRVVFDFTVVGGKVVSIEMLADRTLLDELDLLILDQTG